MAAPKTNMPKLQDLGPFLDAALICEGIVLEKDGTYSAIRLINRITFHDLTVKKDVLVEMPLSILIGFKAGNLKDTRDLSIYVTNPSQKRELLQGWPSPFQIEFTGDDTGVVIPISGFYLRYDVDGTYWIDIILGGKRFSRLPLTLRTQNTNSVPNATDNGSTRLRSQPNG